MAGAIQVFLDRAAHPKDLQPTWLGHSIGEWEGDSLIVDTVGFNDRSWIDSRGTPRTEQLHIVERIRRVDFGHLEVETTIDDPGVFVKPWIPALKGQFQVAGFAVKNGQLHWRNNARGGRF